MGLPFNGSVHDPETKTLVLELNLRISFRFITMLLFSIASGLIQLIPPLSPTRFLAPLYRL